MNKRVRVSITNKLFFLFLLLPFNSLSEERSKLLMMNGHFFKKGETHLNKNNAIFQYEKWLVKNKGETRLLISYFKNKKGKVVAKEKLLFKGKGLVSYELDQFQIGEHGTFLLKDRSSLEILYKEGKKVKKSYLKWKGNFILPPMIPDYIRDNFSILNSKGSMEVELVVPHLQTNISFTFYLKNKRNPECFEKAFFCILFKPSNFFIGLFTDSLFLSFDKKLKLIKASGPTLLYWRKGKEEGLTPFIGDSYFKLDK